MSADSERSTATPSTDRIDPQANAWMSQGDLGRPGATGSPGSTPVTSRIGKHAQSARVLDLARRTGLDPEELAARIDPDVIRRTKYPVHATRNADGTTTYTHDIGVREGLQSGLGKDFSEEVTPAPRDARRDSAGRFVPRT